MGLAPYHAEKGDLICILWGGQAPFLISETGQLQLNPPDGPTLPHYRFIGECYLHGIMDGEATREQMAERKDPELFLLG